MTASRRERWERGTLAKALDRGGERRSAFRTSSGIDLGRLYTEEDLPADLSAALGFPGEFPFTRGVQPTMYRGRFWTMRQYAGFGTAEESNRRYHYLLDQGQTGLSVAFDLPTQMGYDSDAPMAEGEVGRSGVAISSLEDMERLFLGIPLDRVSTSMTINATAPILLALYVAVAEKQGVPPAKLQGTVQNDLLKEYAARGTYIFPPGPSMRLITDVMAYCKDALPQWNTISISGYHMREAGSTAVQEVAFTLANACAYVEHAVRRGLKVDDFAPRLSFFFNVHNHFLEEVAKFRAARRLWARIMRDRFAARDPRSGMLRFHAQTGGSTLTAQQPRVNLMRVTLQVMAAVLGGAQSIHANGYDEALALPTEEAALLALRTQQVIAHESGAADTVDPLGGSYAVEALTEAIEAKARDYIERIDRMGGAVRAIEEGFLQREIHESAYAHQKALEAKETVVVGVNEFVVEEAPPKGLLRVDPALEEKQRRGVRALKARRAAAPVARALEALRRGAEGEENLLPRILDAVRAYATLGEISDILRGVFGTWKPPA